MVSISDLFVNGKGGNENAATKVGEVNSFMLPSLDESLLKIYEKMMSEVDKALTDSLRQQIQIVVEQDDETVKRELIEGIKVQFGLEDKQIDAYVKAFKIEKIYKVILNELEELVLLVSDGEILEMFGDYIEQIRVLIENLRKMLTKFNEEDLKLFEHGKYSFSSANQESVVDKYPELASAYNFILYTSNAEQRRKATVESKSGIGFDSMRGIGKDISMLNQVSYQTLKNETHRIQYQHIDYYFTKYTALYRRYGGGTNKVGFITVSISPENLSRLRKIYQNEKLEFLIMIISFGNFKNEGISEDDLYINFKNDANSFVSEIEEIIKIFNEPFTPESLAKACSIIEQGVDITRSLKDNPTASLTVDGHLKK